MAFRKSNQEFAGIKDKWLTIIDQQTTGISLLFATIAVLIYAIIFVCRI